jgi:hypothetical protein
LRERVVWIEVCRLLKVPQCLFHLSLTSHCQPAPSMFADRW